MKILITPFIILAVILSLPLTISMPITAQAQVNDHYSVPLAVVRFNQPRVYFQRPVGNAIRSALNVSRDISFNIVHYVPAGSSMIAKKADNNLQKIIEHIYSMGVSSQNLSVKKQIASGMPHSEVHIYVR